MIEVITSQIFLVHRKSAEKAPFSVELLDSNTSLALVKASRLLVLLGMAE